MPWDRVGEITLHHSYGGIHSVDSTNILVKVKLEAEERKQMVYDLFNDSSDTQDGYTGILVGNNAKKAKNSLKKITQIQMLYTSSKDRHVS